MTAILSILLSSILAFKMRRTGLFSIFIKSFRIGILQKFLELPSDVGFHLGIFIIKRLIGLIDFGLQCHALTFACFLDSSQTQFLGLQVANQVRQRIFINVLGLFNGDDLSMESLRQRSEHLSYNLGFENSFPKIKGKVDYVLQLGIEPSNDSFSSILISSKLVVSL